MEAPLMVRGREGCVNSWKSEAPARLVREGGVPCRTSCQRAVSKSSIPCAPSPLRCSASPAPWPHVAHVAWSASQATSLHAWNRGGPSSTARAPPLSLPTYTYNYAHNHTYNAVNLILTENPGHLIPQELAGSKITIDGLQARSVETEGAAGAELVS